MLQMIVTQVGSFVFVYHFIDPSSLAISYGFLEELHLPVQRLSMMKIYCRLVFLG